MEALIPPIFFFPSFISVTGVSRFDSSAREVVLFPCSSFYLAVDKGYSLFEHFLVQSFTRGFAYVYKSTSYHYKMSTSFVPSKSPEGAFSYAAAASGKHSPKATTATPTHMNNSGAGTPNGTLLDITKAEAVEFSASLDTANTPKQKASSSSLSSGIATVDNGEPSSFSSSSDRKLPNDEGGSNSEKAYQSEGDQLDSSKQPTKVAEASRERLVPAPPPSVNIWHVRAEGFREAKAKMQPVATVPLHAATSKSASPKSTEKPVEAKNPERRRTGKQTDTCAWDTEKGRENSYDRKDVQKDGRDRKKSTDAGRANGYPPREDGEF